MADDVRLASLLRALARSSAPLMIRQCASEMQASLPTASKYVEIAQAAGLVEVTTFATAKQVALTPKGRRRAET